MRRLGLCLALAALVAGASSCSHVQTVRLQEETVEVAPGLRPLAAIQADALSAYLLFIPIPGNVNLDRVINQLLIASAKTMGADKVVLVNFESTPDGGVWALLHKILGWRSAEATAIAVQVTGPAADPGADQGPEPGPTTTPSGSGSGSGRGSAGPGGDRAPAPAGHRRGAN